MNFNNANAYSMVKVTPAAVTPVTTTAILPKPIVKSWADSNALYLYNEAHIYGSYRVHMKEFLDWCKDGKTGTCFKEDMAADLHIYGYKADPVKKFVTLNVRSDNIFRTVKMFEPMSSNFIVALADQCNSVYQSYYNLVDPDHVPRTITLPFSAVGAMLDNDYNGKRSTYLMPRLWSTNIKNIDDCVYPTTSLAHVDDLIAQLSASNN